MHVFFDLDGTLTHPHEGITRCIQYALEDAGVEPPAAEDLTRCIGPPLRESFAFLLDTVDEVRLARAMSRYRSRFETIGMFENAVCVGIEDALVALTDRGRRLRVVTAKPTVFARRILEHFELAHFFEGVHGPDLSSQACSKTSLIRDALAAAKARPESVVMVGDRAEDVLGARANGVEAVGVTWGYGSREELADARPTRLVDSVADLLAYLERPT